MIWRLILSTSENHDEEKFFDNKESEKHKGAPILRCMIPECVKFVVQLTSRSLEIISQIQNTPTFLALNLLHWFEGKKHPAKELEYESGSLYLKLLEYESGSFKFIIVISISIIDVVGIIFI
ncbi:2921_t:CDS:1 [Entrophospora sp. SA101]|nr:2921_t:CDS:1 [Entrophospora sp. SA101]